MLTPRAAAILALATTGVAAAIPEEGTIEIYSADGTSEVEMDAKSGRATSPTGIIGVYKDGSNTTVTVRANELRFTRPSEDVEAFGNVDIQSVEQSPGKPPRIQLWRGEHVQGNFRTKTFAADDFRFGSPPFFASGSTLSGTNAPGAVQTAGMATVTTDDAADPLYSVKARRLKIVPGQYFDADGVRFQLGSVPILAWPHWHRSLAGHDRYWTLTPGYRSAYGPFFLSGYHWKVHTNAEVGIALDYRAKRGPGLGPEIKYDLGRAGQGDGAFYWTHDDKPPAIPPVNPDRYRYWLNHTATNDSGFRFQAVLNGQRDPLVLHDFFEGEFRHNPHPDTFFEANQRWSNFSLDILARPQVNQFFDTVERLPDIKFTGLRQQLGNSPLFYESETSAAYLRERSGLLGETNYSAFRGDTYHQVVLPRTYFGWLNVTPRVGGRFSYYANPDSESVAPDDRHRAVLNTGAEISTRASRTWGGITNRTFDLSGLRHVVEPSINYVFVPEPGRRPPELPLFDEELPTLRLLPVDFPDYNAIDSVDSRNVLRFGLRNRLLTRRDGDVASLLSWRVMTDWRLKPEPGQTTFPEVYSDLDFAPRKWLTLGSEVRYDINGERWRESNHRITILPNDTWHWTVGHRYLREDEGGPGPGNNLVYSSVYFRMNENWGFRASHHFEGRDGLLEEQYYTVYRDFRSWTGALTFRLRDQRTSADDWAVVVTFSLKAFPRFKLNEDRDRLERLLGG